MPVAVRRLNIDLPENVADELQNIAHKSHQSMTDVMRTALALVKIASDASENKQKLVVADESGKPIKEVVLPR